MRHPYHWLALRWQLKFNPVGLFQRLNQLDWYRKALLDWTESLPVDRGARLLEIGCATGALSRHLARTATVTAVDQSGQMVAAARRYSAGDNPHFIPGDIHVLPLANRQFDYVIAASVINIVTDPQRALAEMQRLVVNGGLVSALVPDAAMTERKARAIIASLGLRGFSREALWAWHSMAPKVEAYALADHIIADKQRSSAILRIARGDTGRDKSCSSAAEPPFRLAAIWVISAMDRIRDSLRCVFSATHSLPCFTVIPEQHNSRSSCQRPRHAVVRWPDRHRNETRP